MDKNKIIEAAAKLVAKGAYDKAIKEYQKVLEADPKEVRVLQKMGELYQKKNDNVQAATYFTKVAESYSSDGFFLKAVALYKQVLKLNPALIEVNLKLAELHQQLQLMSEAMAYYQLVANHYDKAGDVKASLDTLKKMVDLDPDNVASRIKLAELYARENMNKEATTEFKRAAEYLKRNNRTDDYLRVAERLSALQPDDLVLAKELALAYVQRQDFKRALAKLQVCFKADSRDIDTLNLLAQSFQGLGQTSKTVSVYKELAKVYQDKGRNDEANKVWVKVEQADPNDPDVLARKQASRPQPPAAAQSAPTMPGRPSPAPQPSYAQPQAQTAPQPSAGPTQPNPAMAQQAAAAAAPKPAVNPQLAKLLTETDVYVKYGLHDKALEHLRKVFAVDPENLDAHEKAYHIYVAANNQAQASEQLLNVLRLCTRRADVARAQPYLATLLQQNPGHPEVPAFLAVLKPAGGAAVQAQPDHELPDDAILVDSSDEEVIVADAPEDALAGQTVESLNLRGRVQPEREPEEELVAEPEMIASEEVESAVSDEIVQDEIVQDEPFMAESSGEVVVDEPVLESEPEVVTGETDVPFNAFASEDEDPKTEIGRPLASAEQLETMARGGYASPQVEEEFEPQTTEAPVMDEAPVLDEEPQTGEFEQPLSYQSSNEFQTDTTENAAPAYLEEPVAAEEAVEEAVEEPVEAPAEEDPASEECDEAQFFLDQGLTEEAREVIETVLIAYPGHQRAQELMARLEEMEAQGGAHSAAEDAPPPEEEVQPPSVEPVAPEEAAEVAAQSDGGEKDAFDLAAELADELGELGGEEEAAPEAPAGDEFQISVDQVFSEFKKGLQKVVKPEDVDTHYDLGIAYKEMGLIDDAIGEFDQARQGCIGKKKEVDCLSMIGTMQRDFKGDAAAAVGTFKQAAQSEHAASGEVQKAILYELASTYEAAGEPGKALYHFQVVQKLDPKYRDIAQRVSALGSTKPVEDPIGKPTPPKGSGGANGANGAHGGGSKPPSAGPKGGSGAAPTEPPKSRKVGYV